MALVSRRHREMSRRSSTASWIAVFVALLVLGVGLIAENRRRTP
ncbi:hypothetical protein SAMN04488544_2961 [Microlunatus sagamiharensis]|uniref:Uncharacterized protein n=1 Tax=Microlunatus sagamiharensis TaxID=546874 RepID=A0A1H2MY78_9ACTN|nr:hypothetical protein [Microlunatus sagamiharensis]SDU98217.1 hypothetical protein SAMN04488544_2961 [Microlunatus sagamiharensis]